MPQLMTNGVAVPVATPGATAWACAWGEQGANEASATPVKFAVTLDYTIDRRQFAAASVNVVAADFASGIWTAEEPGSAVLSLRTLTAMGLTAPVSGKRYPLFKFQTTGPGLLFINAATGVRIEWNGLEPQSLPRYHGVVTVLYCGIDSVTSEEVWNAN